MALAGAALVFEASTIVLVQYGITHAADVAASASTQRVQGLHASIATPRATATALHLAWFRLDPVRPDRVELRTAGGGDRPRRS